jgi:nitrogen fixation NifU-like protein
MEAPIAEQGETADFDTIVAVLQKALSEQIEAIYSAKVLEEARHPSNMGALLKPDGHAVVLGSCGDTMEMFLRIDGSRIEIATFGTDGCGPTVACGSMLTRMVQGMTLDQAGAVDGADLIDALDGLPAENVHCATLAVATLREAIANRRLVERAGQD